MRRNWNNSLVGGCARAEVWTSAPEGVTLYCTWRRIALTTGLHRQVRVAAARLVNFSSVMTSCLLHSNYSSTDRPIAWLRCDSVTPSVAERYGSIDKMTRVSPFSATVSVSVLFWNYYYSYSLSRHIELEGGIVWNGTSPVIRAQAVYFPYLTMPSATCLRLSDVSVICRVTYFQFPI